MWWLDEGNEIVVVVHLRKLLAGIKIGDPKYGELASFKLVEGKVAMY